MGSAAVEVIDRDWLTAHCHAIVFIVGFLSLKVVTGEKRKRGMHKSLSEIIVARKSSKSALGVRARSVHAVVSFTVIIVPFTAQHFSTAFQVNLDLCSFSLLSFVLVFNAFKIPARLISPPHSLPSPP